MKTFEMPGTCPECGHMPMTGANPTSVKTTDYRYETRSYVCNQCHACWDEKWQVVLVTVTRDAWVADHGKQTQPRDGE